MGFAELLMTALGLAMDAFAVSVGMGMNGGSRTIRKALAAGIYFGAFQGLMPVAGYFAGSAAAGFITSIDHWLAFGLLAVIGAGMFREAVTGKEQPHESSGTTAREMLPLALATSIDAFAAGLGIAFLGADIFAGSAVIAAVTFVLSFAGVFLGRSFGGKLKRYSQIAGGAVLILTGIKILFEHLLCG